MAFVVALLGLVLVWALVRSRFGRSLIAVRDHEAAATSVGIDLAHTKVLAFALSAMYAGVAGSLERAGGAERERGRQARDVPTVDRVPRRGCDRRDRDGARAALGGFAVVYIQNAATKAFPGTPVVSPATYGIVLIVLMYVLPEGVAGGVRRLRTWGGRTLRSRRRSTASPARL